jgi:hypothetical protein
LKKTKIPITAMDFHRCRAIASMKGLFGDTMMVASKKKKSRMPNQQMFQCAWTLQQTRIGVWQCSGFVVMN